MRRAACLLLALLLGAQAATPTSRWAVQRWRNSQCMQCDEEVGAGSCACAHSCQHPAALQAGQLRVRSNTSHTIGLVTQHSMRCARSLCRRQLQGNGGVSSAISGGQTALRNRSAQPRDERGVGGCMRVPRTCAPLHPAKSSNVQGSSGLLGSSDTLGAHATRASPPARVPPCRPPPLPSARAAPPVGWVQGAALPGA